MGKFKIYLCTALVLVAPNFSWACKSFALGTGDSRFVAKSFDFYFGEGSIVINKRFVEKTSLVLKSDDTPAFWTSKYGSVTFHQAPQEFPFGGINEKGLTVEVLWLDSATTEPADGRPTANEAQVIQYLLDQAQTVEEAISFMKQIRIHQLFNPVSLR